MFVMSALSKKRRDGCYFGSALIEFIEHESIFVTTIRGRK